MAPDTAALNHPTIGSIKGTQHSPNVEQYLGIKYATLTDRFARGQPVESYPSSVDATSQGHAHDPSLSPFPLSSSLPNITSRPLPVANPQNCDLEHLLLQHELPHPPYTFSDRDCLTLNVTAPSAAVRSRAGGKPLPVLVYVHGGGFVTGSASWPQWDLANLVELSVAHGSPIVAVGVK